ncbi:MAG: class I SAM-dependent RNA methyltransferase [Chloroflexi bacterium]|nr:class I SAM-dependent RNA methyltransferase [Chloroflexota bacterium]
MAKSNIITLDKLAYGGEAIGRLPDGRAVFVPYSLPGETVRVELVEDKRGFARAQLLEVKIPDAERTAPRCPHFMICGGCHYQHMSYAAQLKAKAEILRDQLERIGKLESPPVKETVASPQQWNYRNHVQFHLDPHGQPGFHAPRSEEIVTIKECHLPVDALNSIWPQFDIAPQSGIERIGLRQGAGEVPLLILESSKSKAVEFEIDFPVAAVHLGPEGLQVLADTYYMDIDVLERQFRVSAGSFFQVNTPVAEKMVKHLLEHLPLSEDTTLLEIYSGVGLFSAFLAPQVKRLIAVELDARACDDFIVNLAEFENVELYQDSAENVLPDMKVNPQIVLVDPPRAGLARPVLDAILRLAAPTLAYVSCDPATLARDAKRLTAGGYQLRQVTPFDMFPQTYHIESISFWDRK